MVEDEVEIELMHSEHHGIFAIEAKSVESLGSQLFNPYDGQNLIDHE